MKTKQRRGKKLSVQGEQFGTGAQAAREWWDKSAGYASPRIDQAREWATPRVEKAREWAEPRIEQARDRSVEMAAPRIEAAAARLAPAIDATRDRLVDDVLPKVSAAAQAAAARAEDNLALADVPAGRTGKGGGAKARKATAKAEKKARKKAARSGRRRVGRVVWVLSALGAVAVGAVVVMRRRQAETDPWAQPYPTYPPLPDTDEDAERPETDHAGTGPTGVEGNGHSGGGDDAAAKGDGSTS